MDENKKEADERVLSRLRKLWTMAERGTAEERAIATVKAQKILLEYRIDIANELNIKSEEVEVVWCDSIVNMYVSWILGLSELIAKNFRCRLLVRHTPLKKGKQVQCALVGLKLDAQVGSEVLKKAVEYALLESKRVVNYYQYKHGTSKGVKEEFMRGYISGLEEAFYQQVLEKNEYALVLVIPKEVNEYMGNYSDAELITRVTQKSNTGYAHHAGFQKGKEFLYEMNEKLSNSDFKTTMREGDEENGIIGY